MGLLDMPAHGVFPAPDRRHDFPDRRHLFFFAPSPQSISIATTAFYAPQISVLARIVPARRD